MTIYTADELKSVIYTARLSQKIEDLQYEIKEFRSLMEQVAGIEDVALMIKELIAEKERKVVKYTLLLSTKEKHG